MKVVYTEPALADLGEIAAWLTQNYPGLGRAVERRLEVVIAHIARWPRACDVLRAIVRGAIIEILHLHHIAREPWDEQGQ